MVSSRLSRIISFYLEKPPVIVGCLHLKMCTPQVFGISNISLKSYKNEKMKTNEEEKKNVKN